MSHYQVDNLVYFTLFNREEYLELIELCLQTLIKSNPFPVFDLLFFTEPRFESKIREYTKNFKNKVYINTSFRALNKMKASMNKLNIFHFEYINKYKKVLFIDCDVFICKDLTELFTREWPVNVLCVYNNPDVIVKGFRSKYHGITSNITDEKISDLSKKGIRPFNAGHFAFVNTSVIQKHFNNVIWLTKVWPGPYFYEQSFMNHYFALNEIVDYTLLKNEILLVNLLLKGSVDIHNFYNKSIVHFIGVVESPGLKLQKIKDYHNAYFNTV